MIVKIAESKKEILDHYSVRGEVFIVEQQISFLEEFDQDDYDAVFFVLYDGDLAIGAARLVGNKVGRVAVKKAHRHKKAGTILMQAVEDYAKKQGLSSLKLGAQMYIIPFYEQLGYEAYGDIFLDADIEHKMMKKSL
ncbi:MAG: GNAT family N-acetyltransferase [Candidatus Izemoplasmataceae bacterium]